MLVHLLTLTLLASAQQSIALVPADAAMPFQGDLALWVPEVPAKSYETPATVPPPLTVAVDNPARGTGALSGKSVYLSQGHGWTWNPTLGRWATQRGNTWGAVEDFLNAESMNQFLIPYLENAGATVFPVREADNNPHMVIVDNDDAPDGPSGTYEEFGSWETSTAPGFSHLGESLESGINPFAYGTTRYAWAEPGGTSLVRFTPEIPEAGYYSVSVSYAASPNRVTDALFRVVHPGAVTSIRVNQRSHGSTWVRLGTFYFEKGRDPARGAVELLSDSASSDGTLVVSADAVKFGGGIGLLRRGTGSGVANGPTSGRPRFEENARYSVQFNGAPVSVYDWNTGDDGTDDVSSRSRYAAWQHEEGEDAVYISWHTNAPSPGKGTSTYVYGTNEPNGQYLFSGVEGSDVLAEFVHNEVVSDIQAGYDAGWRDLGLYSAWFGELNPDHNPEMPSMLIEVGFHDTESECYQLQDPQHRVLVARAIYQGIVRYFAWKDGVQPVFVPETPRQFRVQTYANGITRLSWAPPPTDDLGVLGDVATGYRVYSSRDGRAFDDGVDVGNVYFHDVTDLLPGEPRFFRVTATNNGGEGFPTPTLGSMRDSSGKRGTIVVSDFSRLDRGLLIHEDLSAFSNGTVTRMNLQRMNRFDFVVEHGLALAAHHMPFDSAWSDVPLLAEELGSYLLVDWISGEQSSGQGTFSSEELSRLADVRDAGVALLASGSEIGWDLVEQGDEVTRAAFEALFEVSYVGDDAETYQAILDTGVAFSFDDGMHGSYDVDYPDIVLPLNGGAAVVTYAGVTSGVAGAVWSGQDRGPVAFLGFPFETVWPEEARHTLMGVLMNRLEVSPPDDDDPLPPLAEHRPDIPDWDPFSDLSTGEPDSDLVSQPDAPEVVEETIDGESLPADVETDLDSPTAGKSSGGCNHGDDGGRTPLFLLAVVLGGLWLRRRNSGRGVL